MSLLLLTCIIIAAHIVETTTGFGATVIALSLGVHLVPLEVLVVALVLVGWVQSAWLVSRGFSHIQWKLLVTRILPLCALGLLLGMWCFHELGSKTLKLLLGAFVVLVSSMELRRLFRKGSGSRVLPVPTGLAFLVCGGFFHGLFASGGPLVVYYATRELDEKKSFRVTLSVLWLLLNSVLIGSYCLSGDLDTRALVLAVSFIPALVCGIVVGEFLHTRVNEIAFKKLVQTVLLFTGIFLLV
jgi:uncharacterized membrane protein YfcA